MTDSNVRDLYQRACQSYDKNGFTEANLWFEEVIKSIKRETPDTDLLQMKFDSYLYISKYYGLRGDLEKAKNAYRNAHNIYQVFVQSVGNCHGKCNINKVDELKASLAKVVKNLNSNLKRSSQDVIKANIYAYLGAVYECQSRYYEACSNYYKAYEIKKNIPSENSDAVAKLLVYIQSLPSHQSNFTNTLQNNQQQRGNYEKPSETIDEKVTLLDNKTACKETESNPQNTSVGNHMKQLGTENRLNQININYNTARCSSASQPDHFRGLNSTSTQQDFGESIARTSTCVNPALCRPSIQSETTTESDGRFEFHSHLLVLSQDIFNVKLKFVRLGHVDESKPFPSKLRYLKVENNFMEYITLNDRDSYGIRFVPSCLILNELASEKNNLDRPLTRDNKDIITITLRCKIQDNPKDYAELCQIFIINSLNTVIKSCFLYKPDDAIFDRPVEKSSKKVYIRVLFAN
ncbi:uncharacterized protein TRIADDRAFT_52781 [Trichoplax adhaerens]|uniref:Uncharacterized protein n=1 Tax=Trichoplax adhaerens TaxID=10228 RepID=B3RKB3_TRIAD|nr:predicted protein [Trichoplax adhaerens]EDV29168.1 predicted protein [Trichoplax adhaerens]|eukprot:XP_002108370.1 predicted protein [Trichoplax adhaerens]